MSTRGQNNRMKVFSAERFCRLHDVIFKLQTGGKNMDASMKARLTVAKIKDGKKQDVTVRNNDSE